MSRSKIHSILTNGIGWELYSGDGRKVVETEDGAGSIHISPEELDFIGRIADRVMRDLGIDGGDQE